MQKTKVIGYCRVSSKGQEDNTSLEYQKQQIELYCKLRDFELVQIYEETHSGKTLKRPIFETAIQSVLTEGIDGLVSTKFDRISRNTLDILTLLKKIIKPNNKRLYLIESDIDVNTPIGELILTQIVAVATFEREQIMSRTKSGKTALKEKGLFSGGGIPFGKKVVDNQLVNDEEELKTIDTIKRHHKRGKSYNAIAEFLNKNIDKYPTKKTNSKWHARTIIDILKS